MCEALVGLHRHSQAEKYGEGPFQGTDSFALQDETCQISADGGTGD